MGSLHPAWVKEEMMVIKLDASELTRLMDQDKVETYAIKRLRMKPVPVRMKLTRTS